MPAGDGTQFLVVCMIKVPSRPSTEDAKPRTVTSGLVITVDHDTAPQKYAWSASETTQIGEDRPQIVSVATIRRIEVRGQCYFL
jgi:hypothetical protein